MLLQALEPVCSSEVPIILPRFSRHTTIESLYTKHSINAIMIATTRVYSYSLRTFLAAFLFAL